MATANDLWDFSKAGLNRQNVSLGSENKGNVKSKEELQGFLNDTLKPLWTTDAGKEAIRLLEEFLDQDYDEYVSYLTRVEDGFEDIIPKLENINQA